MHGDQSLAGLLRVERVKSDLLSTVSQKSRSFPYRLANLYFTVNSRRFVILARIYISTDGSKSSTRQHGLCPIAESSKRPGQRPYQIREFGPSPHRHCPSSSVSARLDIFVENIVEQSAPKCRQSWLRIPTEWAAQPHCLASLGADQFIPIRTTTTTTTILQHGSLPHYAPNFSNATRTPRMRHRRRRRRYHAALEIVAAGLAARPCHRRPLRSRGRHWWRDALEHRPPPHGAGTRDLGMGRSADSERVARWQREDRERGDFARDGTQLRALLVVRPPQDPFRASRALHHWYVLLYLAFFPN